MTDPTSAHSYYDLAIVGSGSAAWHTPMISSHPAPRQPGDGPEMPVRPLSVLA